MAAVPTPRPDVVGEQSTPPVDGAARPISMGSLLDRAALAVVATDGYGAVLSLNARASDLLGGEAMVVGRLLADSFAEPDAVAAAIGRLTTGPLAPVLGLEVSTVDGVQLELSCVRTETSEGTAVVLVLLLDPSARDAANVARADLADRLRAVSRAQEFLLRASDVLAGAFGVEETLARLAVVAVPTLGDLCLIDVVSEDGSLVRMAAAHADAAAQPWADELRAKYSPVAHGPHPGAAAVDSRQARWSPEMTDDFLRATSRDERHYELVKDVLHFVGYIAVPLVAEDEVLGSVTLVSCRPERRFGPEDVELAEALAGRVALVVAKARRYDREHHIAETLQRSMLTAVPQFAHLDLAARYVPARTDTQVGGDWYDAFRLPSGDQIVVIGDVVGHDLEAATTMGQLRNALRGLAWDRGERPGEVLSRLDALNDSLGIAQFASVLVGVIHALDDGGARFTWSNAGHLPPLLVLADGTTSYLDAEIDIVIGVLADVDRHEAVTVVPAGSTLLLMTDGLVERRADQLDTGMDELARLAGTLTGLHVDDMCDALLTGLLVDAEDDIALLAIRVRP